LFFFHFSSPSPSPATLRGSFKRASLRSPQVPIKGLKGGKRAKLPLQKDWAARSLRAIIRLGVTGLGAEAKMHINAFGAEAPNLWLEH